jgi:hypothetical protein
MDKSIGNILDMIKKRGFSLPQSLNLGVMLVDFMAGSACQRNVEVSEAPIQPHFFQGQTEVIPLADSWDFALDPDFPLFAHFPSEFHSNWQWWQLVKNARTIILDKTPAEYRPLIQTLDNFARNHKLGII